MIKRLFQQRFNLVELWVVAFADAALSSGHWVIAVLIMVFGIILSMWGEGKYYK